jgi:hypothetical protein
MDALFTVYESVSCCKSAGVNPMSFVAFGVLSPMLPLGDQKSSWEGTEGGSTGSKGGTCQRCLACWVRSHCGTSAQHTPQTKTPVPTQKKPLTRGDEPTALNM